MEEAIKVIVQNITSFHPLETGGILIGEYDENLRMATIKLAVPAPPDSKHEPTGFYRGVKGINKRLNDEKLKDSSVHYLGEWHSHPNSSPNPSKVDFIQMKKFAATRNYGIQKPLLLIVGGSPLDTLRWQFNLYKPGESLIPLYRI